MKILITGSTGFLGPFLMMEFSKIGDVSGVARYKADYQYDLCNPEAVKHLISRTNPQMIIHAAGETDVELCQKNSERAIESNCKTTENIVRYMSPDCRLIYISSDMVYSGIGPHKEHSKSENPINIYGMSKLMGEFAAAKAASYLNVRTNLYGLGKSGERRSSLVDFLVSKFRSGEAFSIFTDSLFSPLWAQTLAQKLVIMAKSRRNGTFNLGASDGMSKAKFALLVADGLGLSPKGARPVESTTIPNRTARPLDTRMDIARAEASFGFTLPSMESDIKAMCEIYKCIN